jgi:SAM-dependent methyltransferase
VKIRNIRSGKLLANQQFNINTQEIVFQRVRSVVASHKLIYSVKEKLYVIVLRSSVSYLDVINICGYLHPLLDVCCGNGEALSLLFDQKRRGYVVGVDACADYLWEAKNKMVYDDLVLADVRHLPFRTHSFVTVLALEVIEHLPKRHGCMFLQELNRIGKRIILSTPLAFHQQILPNYPLQLHVSYWKANELQIYGFSRIGIGLCVHKVSKVTLIKKLLTVLFSFLPILRSNFSQVYINIANLTHRE